jgi:hypothetical protein
MFSDLITELPDGDMQVGAIRVYEQDLREAAEEREGCVGHLPGHANSLSYSNLNDLMTRKSLAAFCWTRRSSSLSGLLLDEEVFLSQLHRRAKLLNGNLEPCG